jgi:probable F420-dependent oxidoreductase
VPELLGSAGGPTIGVFADCTDRSMPIVDLAVALEERGFTGIYLTEHPHLPVANDRSSFPAGGAIPDRYARFWDPYIALSFVAARTSLDIGTCISLVGEHDAIALAKAIATLDVLSGGRLHVGVGFGWHREEFEAHGLSAKVRAPVVEETVALMKELWTQEVASFDGTYRQLAPSRSWPKPVQQPHPPVLLGAPARERTFRRVAAWADGWIPMGGPIFEPVYAEWIRDLHQAFEDAGRDPKTCRIIGMLARTPQKDLRAAWERAGELGHERVLVHVPEAGANEVLPLLDEYARILAD